MNNEPITWTRDGEYGGNAVENAISNCQRAVSFMIGERGLPTYSDPIEEYLSEV